MKVKSKPCTSYGKSVKSYRSGSTYSDECFNDLFWKEKVYYAKNGDKTEAGCLVARINNNHYVIGHETNEPKKWRGFGGDEFIIKFTSGPHKGKVVTTTNLWYQGKIDERYRDKLPDNAIFIKE